MTGHGCDGHAGLGADARSAVLSVLDRLGPALERLREGAGPDAVRQSAETCTYCPVCAVIAVVRGERPEFAVRFAEQAGAMLAVLRAALEEGDPAASTRESPPEPSPPAPGRRVQHIRVDRPRPTR